MPSDHKEIEIRRKLLLRFQTALLGMITPALRGVAVSWTDRTIVGRLLFDSDVADNEFECASDVEAEVAAAFPDHEVGIKAETYPHPRPMIERGLDAWVYRRKE
jgi:hypothetical protein